MTAKDLTTDSVDPIFAAIKFHSGVLDALNYLCSRVDVVAAAREGRQVSQADKDASKALDKAEMLLTDALCQTVPTTMKGVRAGLKYIEHLTLRSCCYHPEKPLAGILKSPLLAA